MQLLFYSFAVRNDLLEFISNNVASDNDNCNDGDSDGLKLTVHDLMKMANSLLRFDEGP